jgi:hypothetical protein
MVPSLENVPFWYDVTIYTEAAVMVPVKGLSWLLNLLPQWGTIPEVGMVWGTNTLATKIPSSVTT